jgi:GAF domain-containing protein
MFPGAVVPSNSESLSQGLAAMSRFFVGDATLAETLQNVSDLACGAVPTADMVGLTMLVDGRAKTAVSTDPDATEIDSAQYSTGNGPCLDAFRHQKVYRIDDMETDGQWPSFSEAAAAKGVNSSMSIPLVARHEGVGALNFYSRGDVPFSDDDVEVGLQFASHAAIVLANSQAYWDSHQLSQDLVQAMQSRATIEQAKGILMGAQRCGADEAFQILVRASQRENRKLRRIAEEIVAKTTDPGRGQAAS